MGGGGLMARYGLGKRRQPSLLRSGGTEYEPGSKPAPKPQSPGIETPPTFSFDPSIEAQRREAKRGLEDTEGNVATEQHFAAQDLHHALRKIHQTTVRGRQDLNRSAQRKQQGLTYQEQDSQRRNDRANQDFNTSLSNIARQFGQQGHRQAEAANASGVLDQGTLTASAAARAGNQSLAEAPIRTAQGRTNEDLGTALSRIATGRGEVSADQERSLGRLKQDRAQEQAEAQRTTGRKKFETTREQERARVEYENKNVDLLSQEIYAARQEHPAIFKKWLNEHPQAMAAAKARAEHKPPVEHKPKKGRH